MTLQELIDLRERAGHHWVRVECGQEVFKVLTEVAQLPAVTGRDVFGCDIFIDPKQPNHFGTATCANGRKQHLALLNDTLYIISADTPRITPDDFRLR